MARLSFDSVEALIYDPVSANRTATRAALYSLGFRRTETVSTLEGMIESIQKSPPDLVLCETQGMVDELCAVVQKLRQGSSGHNPFIVIIATAWQKSASLIGKVVDSGADDLLLRPFSTALLGSRIEAHIERRKGFVITSEYVGPDRRRDYNRGANPAPTFDPPNSLKMKAKEKLTADVVAKRLDNELKVAREKLNSEKLRRDSFQICILWRLMQEQTPATPLKDLDKLSDLARSIDRRTRDTEFDDAIKWCDSVLAAAEGLHLGVDRNASMHLLGHAALNLNQIFCPDKSPADQLNEIDSTVTIIRARNQTAIAS